MQYLKLKQRGYCVHGLRTSQSFNSGDDGKEMRVICGGTYESK